MVDGELLCAPSQETTLGLYVHFPYCRQKCHYCDFNAHAISFDETTYTEAVLRELDRRAPTFLENFGNFQTVYFGGGTPSLWSPTEVGRVLSRVRSLGLSASPEVTLEANPGTVSQDRLTAYRQQGINRFSIGLQSLVPSDLQVLGRLHDTQQGRLAVQNAKNTGAQVTIDLIYALHNQSFKRLEDSLKEIVSLEPDHISAYTLTVEPGTPLGKKHAAGKFAVMPSDEQATMIQAVSDFLGGHQFTRYEVSNYAQPGREAIHNSIYWTGGPYLGVGAGAHSYLPDKKLTRANRQENLRPPDKYVAASLAGELDVEFKEELDRSEVIGERAMLALRTRFGLDIGRLEKQAESGGEIRAALAPALDTLCREGLLKVEHTRFVPTKKGFLFGDAIGRSVLAAMDAVRPTLDSR